MIHPLQIYFHVGTRFSFLLQLTTYKYSTPLLDSLRFSYLKLSVKEVLELKDPCDQEEYAFNKALSD